MAKATTKRSSSIARERARRGGEAAKLRHAGIQKPVEPDDVLGEIVGHRAQARTEMTRRIWDYIKAHDLQDPEDGRIIHPDDALGRVLGDKPDVSMFEIARLLNAHVRA